MWCFSEGENFYEFVDRQLSCLSTKISPLKLHKIALLHPTEAKTSPLKIFEGDDLQNISVMISICSYILKYMVKLVNQ